MKKNKILFSGILSLIIGALIFGGLVLFGFANPDIIKASDQKIRVKQGLYKDPIEKVIDASGEVNEINITVPSKNVKIITGDVQNVKITYYEDYQGETQYLFEDGVLNFRLLNKIIFNVEFLSWIYEDYSKTNSVIVEIPQELKCNYNINVSSGNLNTDNITAGILKAVLKSGNISINNSTADNADISVSSGNLNIKDSIISNELKVRTASGNILVNNLSSESLLASVSSGNIQVNNSVVSVLDGSSRSGNITLEKIQSESIKLKSSSGNVNIYGLQYQLEDYSYSLKVYSGSIKVNGSRKGSSYERIDAEKQYFLTATAYSGNIVINE